MTANFQQLLPIFVHILWRMSYRHYNVPSILQQEVILGFFLSVFVLITVYTYKFISFNNTFFLNSIIIITLHVFQEIKF